MSQGSLAVPTVGVLSGLTMAQDINNALAALCTQSSGSSAPTNAPGGVALLGQLWLDTTSATLPILKQFDGAAWQILGTIDVSNSIWTPPIGGGANTTLASATTTDLGSKPEAYLTVSGVTTITSLGSSAKVGTIHVVTFSGILTLTHNGASLILPTAANIATAAGDTAWFAYLGSGNWKCLNYMLASGASLSTAAVGAGQLIASSQGMNAPLNLRINATVSGGALTVAIKTAANADADATHPVLVPFRDATIATGDPIIASLQAALSFATPVSGNTFGAPSSNIPFRLWVILYYNAGTLAVGVINASSIIAGVGQTYPLNEGNVVTTAASTNGGSALGTYYANVSAITNTPFRIIGYLDWASGLATAGTFASAPTTIKLFGPGDKKPGDVVQEAFNVTGAVNTGAGVFVNNDVIPTSTQGTQFMSQAITPSATPNLLCIEHVGNYNSNASQEMTMALFQDAGANAIASMMGQEIITANGLLPWTMTFYMLAATVSQTTFKVKVGGTGGTTTFNGVAGTRRYGGSLASVMRVKEIMG